MALQRVRMIRDAAVIGDHQPGADPLAGIGKHPVRLRVFPVDQRGAAGLDDPCLGGGDLGHGVAQVLHMVEAHGGDDGEQWRVDHVGGIEFAAHTHLQDHYVAALLPVIQHGCAGDELEFGGLTRHSIHDWPDALKDIHQILIGNGRSVQGDALVETIDEGRRVQARPVSRSLQDGGQHGAGGTFAVGPRHMDEPQFVLRVPQ